MTEEEIYRGLQTVFSGVFRRHDIKITSGLSARDVPGWDSFKQVSLIIAAEEYFKIKFLNSDIDELENIGDLAKAVARLAA
jgi:acyl carrier protein